jgi:hypothetical protein
LVKAKSALAGIGLLTISIDKDLNGDDMCIFTFGDEQGHNNKITYQMYGKIKQQPVNIPFNSDMFKNILQANKDLEEGSIYLNYDGLMKIEFNNIYKQNKMDNFDLKKYLAEGKLNEGFYPDDQKELFFIANEKLNNLSKEALVEIIKEIIMNFDEDELQKFIYSI